METKEKSYLKKQFFRQIGIATAVLFSMSMVMVYSFPFGADWVALPYSLLFFYFLSISLYQMVSKSFEKSPGKFINTYMLGTLIKFFLMTSIAIGLVLFFPEHRKTYLIGFLASYFFYGIFEVMGLLKINRNR